MAIMRFVTQQPPPPPRSDSGSELEDTVAADSPGELDTTVAADGAVSAGPSGDMARRFAALRAGADPEAATLDTSSIHGGPIAGPGTGVDGKRYSFESVFASGGLGSIRRAFDHRLQRVVAVKELQTYQPGSAGETRFVREALITAQLEHPSIVPIQDFGRRRDGAPYYCMKLVDGQSLDALVRARKDLPERLPLVTHVLAIADALAYAHDKGVIHRDLKPSNVLVGPFGETVVIDWGLAKDLNASDDLRGSEGRTASGVAAKADDLTRTGEFVGTLPFMPLEQAEGDQVDARADVYAIGAILYFVLSGSAPYEGRGVLSVLSTMLAGPPPDLAERIADVPADLLAIVRKAMARKRAERYPSARELAADLRRFQNGLMVSARPYSPFDVLLHFARRHRAILSVAAVALVALAGLGAYSYAQIVQQSREADEQRAEAIAAREAETLARTDAEAERDAAARQARQLVFEDAQDDLERGRTFEAAAKLGEIYTAERDNPSIQYLLGEAMRPVDAIVAVLKGHEGGARSVRFASETSVGVVSQNGAFHLWDLSGPHLVDVVELPDAEVNKAEYEPVGDQWVFSATRRDRVHYSSRNYHASYDPNTRTLRSAERSDARPDLFVWKGETPISVQHYDTQTEGQLATMAVKDAEVEDYGPTFSKAVTARDLLKDPQITNVSSLGMLHAQLTGQQPRSLRENQHSYGYGSRGIIESNLIIRKDDYLPTTLDAWEFYRSDKQPLYPCIQRQEKRLWSEDAGGRVFHVTHVHGKLDPSGRRDDCHVAYLTGLRTIDVVDQSPDGKWTLVAQKGGVLLVLDSREMVVVSTINYPGGISDVRFSPDSSLLAVAFADGNVLVWRHVGAQALGAVRSVRDAIPVTDSRVAYLTHRPDAEVHILDFGDFGQVHDTRLATSSPADNLWTRETDPFLVGRGDDARTADVVDLEKMRRLGVIESDGESWIPIGRTADERYILLSSGENSILYWNTAYARPLFMRRNDAEDLSFFRISPDYMYLTSSSVMALDGVSTRVMDTANGTEIARLPAESMDFSPDGKFAFARGESGVVTMHAVGSFDLVETLVERDAPIVGRMFDFGPHVVHFTPDRSAFLVPEKNGPIRVYEADTRELRGRLPGYQARVGGIVFSPDSTRCVAMERERRGSPSKADLWDLDDLKRLARLDLGGEAVQHATFSPDSSLLALGRADGFVEVWLADEGRFLFRFPVSSEEVRWLRFTPDGRYLIVVAAGRDNYLMLALREIRRETRSPTDVRHLLRDWNHGAQAD